MKISIITVCFNSEKTIEDTIQSVLSQNYPDIEYIIVDGASTDSTLNIIDKYSNKITTVISESDNGIYDAMNKGVKASTGDVVGILNSDDIYANENIISLVVKNIKDTDATYGNLDYVESDDVSKVTRRWCSKVYSEGMFLKGWMPPHPTFFVRKSIYNKLGLYSLELKSAADYELMLRFIHKHKIKLAFIDEVLVKMRIGGESNSSFKNRLRANKEDRKAWKMNNLKPNLFTLVRKPLSKISQFIKKGNS